MKIAIGADHAGVDLKQDLIEYIVSLGHEVEDHGTHTKDSVDYPLLAGRVARAVRKNDADLGVLICGTGVGMSITANKFKGIRAAAVSEVFSAIASREHNNSNILCLGSRVIGLEVAKLIVKSWLGASFQGGRHQKRVELISDFEK
ncbi:MAG: ribose 5-phosphate isomerase B [Acholeplasmataceae bacterium]